jgi:hypothetical protein
VLVAAALAAAAVAALAIAEPASAGSPPQTKYFEHCGTSTWTVPSDVSSVLLTVLGAQGGDGNGDGPGHAPGGLGGSSVGRVSVTPGETLTVVVGCAGADAVPGLVPVPGGEGYGDGGEGGQDFVGDPPDLPPGFANAGGAGGGGTAVLRGGTPLIVAGGGGGGGADSNFDGLPESTVGGAGGGGNSAGGAGGEDLVDCGGLGATTGAAGVPGESSGQDGNPGVGNDGGDGVIDQTVPSIGGHTGSGGGGGGWYGGGSGAAVTNYPCGGGGGGSGYIDAGATSTAGQTGVRLGHGRAEILFQSNVVTLPVNDEDEHATVVAGTSGSAPSVDTSLATAQPGEPAHAGQTASHSVWYRLVAPFDGRARFDTLSSNFDTVLAVYTEDPASHELTEVGSNDDDPGGAGSGSPSVVTVPITQDVDYLIAVDGHEGASGQVALGYQLAAPRPDGRIRVGASGPLRGNDVYGTLTGQSVTSGARRGGLTSYRVSVQNDSGLAERLLLRGQPSLRGFTVRYRTPTGVNITNQVVAGTFRTPAINPGGTYVLRVEVTVTRQAAPSLARTLRTTSTVSNLRSDTVRFTTQRR